jgi:NAD(P)-dependent dehydrogenase (short-subunit alcohol dehydrogenase family)
MQNIVLKGSSRGIGKHIYDHLSKSFNIIGISRKPSKRTQFCCDISSKNEVKKVFKKIKKIDILINNASVTETKKNKIDNFDYTIKSNLNGTFYCCHYALDKLKKSKSPKIINISSINAHVGFPNNPGYVSSKGGVNSLTKSLAVDYGKFNVKVNSLSLGYISEGMSIKSYENKGKRLRRKKNTILNRWGNAEDVIEVIDFIVRARNLYMTGSDLVIDGGWLAKGLK